MVTKADVDMLPTGTGPNELVKLDGLGKLPAVDASNLTNLPGGIGDFNLTSPNSGDVIYYNGTDFVNAPKGSVSGIQLWDADLDTIAALAQGTANVIRSNGTVWQSSTLSLNDLGDVIITAATTGEIVYYNGTNFVNASLSTVGVQPLDSDLTAIAALAQGTANVIRSNGTVWQSTKLSLNDINSVLTTSLTNGDVFYYNGTNVVNAAKGSASGVQAWDADLDTIAALAQGTNNLIVSNGTVWTSTAPGSSSGVQAWDADLDTIAALAQTTGNVIRSNGTVWQSTTLSFNDLGDVIITSATTGDVVFYNGTNFVNGARGTTSGVQAWDADLDTIAALAQGTNNLIVSNGTVWTSTAPGVASGVQPYDADLATIAGLAQGTNNFIVSNGTTWTSSTASLSQLTSPTGNFSFASNKLTNLTDPTQAQDGATKAYVDAAVANLNVHPACAAATTVALTTTYTAGTTGADGGTGVGATLTNAGAQVAFVVDGYTTVVNDRILVKDQADPKQNGIYVVSNIGSISINWVLTRALDYDNGVVATDVKDGDFTFVTEGSANATTGWIQTGTNPLIIGTSNLSFTQFSGAGTYTAGTGLTLTGTQFSITNVGTAGTYKSVTTNAQGQVTAGTNPTTLAGFGIVDAQPLDSDLTTIAALAQTTGNVIRSNGTVWQSTTVSFNDLGDVIITSATTGDVVFYNGTNWVNGARGTTSGVQAWDADLDTISALAQGTNNLIVSNGTVWTSTAPGVASGVQPYDADLTTIAGLAQGTHNLVVSNGTVWTSTAPGSSSGVQAWDADLDTIAALAQGTNNFIVSNGTVWTNQSGNTARTSLGLGTADSVVHNDITAIIKEIHGADIASSGTVNLDTATGNLVDVTGTTTITAITLSNGLERVVRFTGALILTNGTALVLPGNANITTAAGDYAIFRGYASSIVRCVAYIKASGLGIAGIGTQLASAVTITGGNIDNTVIGNSTAAAGTFTAVTGYRPVVTVSGTTKTVALSDSNTKQECSNASPQTVTIPPNSSVAFPIGTEMDFVQFGAGKVTLAAGTGVTINSISSFKSLGAQYAGASLYKQATDVWVLIGNLIA